MFSTYLRHTTKLIPIKFFQQFPKIQRVDSLRPALIKTMTAKVNEEFANFEAKLSLDDPLADYEKLVESKMKADVVLPNHVFPECWRKISAATRDAVWKLLFDETTPQKENLKKASQLLMTFKEDSGFYRADEYNTWIVLVRDELLKRQMLDFWKNVIVANELGPCWARDSDLFEDPDDPEPANFYKYAGCEAQWLKKKGENVSHNAADLVASSLESPSGPMAKPTLKKLSKETPLDDYRHNMEAQADIAPDDDDAYVPIFAEARAMVWQLLFGEQVLTAENSKKAAELLEEHKRDARFYCPYDYNDWIPLVKSELLKRKYFDFWQDVVVKKELGLCWAGDSDYYDDMTDPAPAEFYKVSEELLKEQKK